MSIADKLAQIAENERRVYETGYERGKVVGGGGEEAYMAGKKYEYDKFWDVYQKKGNRTNYAFSFYNLGWNNDTYNPKYPINASGNTNSVFGYSQFTDTKVDIDISKATSVESIFSKCIYLKKIKNLKVSKDTPFKNTSFIKCYDLEDITVTGTIGQSIWFGDSTLLSKKSIENIIGCLSIDTFDKTLTLNKTALESAFPAEGVNLLGSPYVGGSEYESAGGWRFVDNGDGSITISKPDGSANSNGSYPVARDLPLPKGRYIIGDGQNGDGINYSILLSTGYYPDCAFTIEEDGITADIDISVDAPGTITPTLVLTDEWEILKATKPNWTIIEI